jgi:heme exporter protein A
LIHKLSADNLTLIRGERCLFQGLSFALESGGLLILEGRNGCYWNDLAVEKQRQVFHGNLVWLAHRTGLKGDLTLVENLSFERTLRAHSSRDPEEVYERLGIARLKKLILRSLSAGQQRRVALARMLLANVPLWFMDEPFTNLDREGRALVMELVEEHCSAGGMCVMAAHQDVEINAPTTRVKIQ